MTTFPSLSYVHDSSDAELDRAVRRPEVSNVHWVSRISASISLVRLKNSSYR
ncbi:hypothetical protein [Streptomyces sp. NPDC001508]|uniref:hypothetical protein n=1 Tax=Streptomyces sp. NPDC001508 TaxID=3154656 RepID=UPI00331BEB92